MRDEYRLFLMILTLFTMIATTIALLWISGQSIVIQIILITTVVIGIMLTLYEISLYIKYTKANFIKSLIIDFYGNEKIRKIFYKIEYDQFIYNDNFHGGTEDEVNLDRTLAFLDVLGELVIRKVLSIDDVAVLSYEILAIYRNPEVQKYLKNLRKWYLEENIRREPLKGFVYLAKMFEKKYGKRKTPKLKKKLI